MTITLNTTTRPVGYDYARALEEIGALERFISAFPRRQSADLVARLGPKAVFCDFWQLVFLASNRFGGSTKVSRALSHFAKVRLDRCTARNLGQANAVIFYSGAGLETVRAVRRRGILSVSQVHHAHVLEQDRLLRLEAAACGLPYTPIYSPAQVRRQLQEFDEADAIVCPSIAVKESFERAGIPATKLLVVSHGVDLAAKTGEAKREPKPAGSPLKVLYVGQLHYRKGLRYLTQALAEEGLGDADVRLVGPDFGLSGLGAGASVGRLTKTGPKKGEALLQEYREADVFVLPSLEEGFGLVVLEAMRAGLPVILTSAVGGKDFVTDGVQGWVVPPANSDALRQKLLWMREHPAERLAMGEAAAQRARAAGGWTASARKLTDMLALLPRTR